MDGYLTRASEKVCLFLKKIQEVNGICFLPLEECCSHQVMTTREASLETMLIHLEEWKDVKTWVLASLRFWINLYHDHVNSGIPIMWDAKFPHCLSLIELDFMQPNASWLVHLLDEMKYHTIYLIWLYTRFLYLELSVLLLALIFLSDFNFSYPPLFSQKNLRIELIFIALLFFFFFK